MENPARLCLAHCVPSGIYYIGSVPDAKADIVVISRLSEPEVIQQLPSRTTVFRLPRHHLPHKPQELCFILSLQVHLRLFEAIIRQADRADPVT